MHYKNRGIYSINEISLIDCEEFNTIFKKRNKKISQDKKTLVYVDGQYMTKAKLSAIKRKPLTIEQQNDKKSAWLEKTILFIKKEWLIKSE